ncbi:MAG: ribosome silencing factor [Pseudomonadota bacterium]
MIDSAHFLESQSLCKEICTLLDRDKAEQIVAIDVRGKSLFADQMVIATGTSSRHIAAMATRLATMLRKQRYKVRIDGLTQANWVLLDTDLVIVHLFRAEVREYYDLESMWQIEPESA